MMAPLDAPLSTATLLGIVGLGVYGTFHRNSNLFGRVLSHLPGDARRVALTFDDGPNPFATPRVLDLLATHRARATFFLLGRHVKRWPGLVRRIVQEGHMVANHGFTHRRMHFAGPAEALVDLRSGTQAIIDACGVIPRHFRAPNGFRSPFVAAAARRLGQRTVGWSVGDWDSARPGVRAIVYRTLSAVRRGSIVLLHDGDASNPLGDRRQTTDALAVIIPALRQRRYGFAVLP